MPWFCLSSVFLSISCSDKLRLDFDRVDLFAYGCAGASAILCLISLVAPVNGLLSVPPSTALYGLLAGLSLLGLDLEYHRQYRPAQVLSFSAGSIALLAFIGHIYELYGLTSYTGMTVLASILGLGLAVGILCSRPDRGIMAIVISGDPGGIMARRLLIGTIGIPSVLGILRLEGERLGLYDAQRGVSLLVVLTIVCFMVMIGWYAHVLDRTDAERRQAEEAKQAAEREVEAQRVQSIRADRLRSLGEMAAGIAHELNQPLVGVRGLAEHMMLGMDRGWASDEEKVREKLSLILDQADRMTHIIQHVRLFAQDAGKPETRPVDLNDVINSATGLLDAQFKARGIALIHNSEAHLPTVSANLYSLEEVLINLLVNARDATEDRMAGDRPPEAPSVTIRTREETQQVILEVTDEGRGIPEDIMPKIFDPFFTTKDPDRGTGLGLAVCKSLVAQFDGTITIRSKPEYGTTVTVSLPTDQSPSDKES